MASIPPSILAPPESHLHPVGHRHQLVEAVGVVDRPPRIPLGRKQAADRILGAMLDGRT